MLHSFPPWKLQNSLEMEMERGEGTCFGEVECLEHAKFSMQWTEKEMVFFMDVAAWQVGVVRCS